MKRTFLLCLVVIIGILSGCSAQSSTSSPSQSQVEIDPHHWRPKTPIPHRTWTEQDKIDFRAAWLKREAASADIPVPDDKLVRWVQSSSEVDELQAKCIQDRGYPQLKISDFGGLEPNVPVAQEKAFNIVYFSCIAQYFWEPKLLTDWNPDMVGLIYDYWVEAYIPCAEKLGITREPNIPTRQEAISRFAAAQNRWFAFESVEYQAREREKSEPGFIKKLNQACPEMPPTEVLYG